MYVYKIHLVFVHYHIVHTNKIKSLSDCILGFYLISQSSLPRKRASRKGLLSGNHVSQVFQDSLNVKSVSNFFPSTTKMFLIFQHFCVQMHLPLWFSHTKRITNHLPVMLSAIIFKVLWHSSWDKGMLAASDPWSSSRACSAEFMSRACSIYTQRSPRGTEEITICLSFINIRSCLN